MNAGQAKATVNMVIGWIAFALAVMAAAKLFGFVIPLNLRASTGDLALVACALAMCRMP